MEDVEMEWHSRAYAISDIRDWSKENRFELQPDFQRKEVWSKPAQIALIDTILRDIPIPKIYIKSILHDDDEKTYRIVVDGQQRLNAILLFLNNKLKLRMPHAEEQYHGMFYKDLPYNIRRQFLAYQLDFNDLTNPTDEEVRDLYARVNKYTVQLNKQELRRADFPGDFLNLAEELSDLEFFNDCKFFSAGQKRRMLDIEYIEELLCVLLDGEQDKKDSLDDFCEKYTRFEQEADVIREEFAGVLNDILAIFGDGICLSKTRFKQRADFYSLFSCILGFRRQGRTVPQSEIGRVREFLYEIDREIAPHSENEAYREYAIRCISDANSIASRRWRKNFLLDNIALLFSQGD
jgi:hypothetical protein